jgi:hypothetical protein
MVGDNLASRKADLSIMVENLLVRALKRVGNAIIDVSLKAIIIAVATALAGVGAFIWLALRGNPHSPWFYAAAGALACLLFMVLVLALLVTLKRRSVDMRIESNHPIRVVRASPDIGPTNLTYPTKVRLEFQNTHSTCIQVRGSRWIPGEHGVAATFNTDTLQFLVDGRWCPDPHGTRELYVGPRVHFRTWIAPSKQFAEDELQRRCQARTLGEIEFLLEGREIRMQV